MSPNREPTDLTWRSEISHENQGYPYAIANLDLSCPGEATIRLHVGNVDGRVEPAVESTPRNADPETLILPLQTNRAEQAIETDITSHVPHTYMCICDNFTKCLSKLQNVWNCIENNGRQLVDFDSPVWSSSVVMTSSSWSWSDWSRIDNLTLSILFFIF